MPEETSAASSSTSMEEKPCSSTSAAADSSVDVMEEAKKLIGTGNRHLVMGDVVSAVNVFQEACGMLAQRYGDTADECGEALFLCGKSLLELARMENSVLGNALEGVPEEEEEGEEGQEKPDSSKVESADNLDEETRDELRIQVYEAMAEKEQTEGEEGKTDSVVNEGKTGAEVKEGKTDSEKEGKTDAEMKEGKTDAEMKEGKADAEKEGKTEMKEGKTDAEMKEGKTDAEKEGKTDAEMKEGKTDAEMKEGKTDAEMKEGKTDAEKEGKTDAEMKEGKTDSEKEGKAEMKEGKTDSEMKEGKTGAEVKEGKTGAEVKEGKTDTEMREVEDVPKSPVKAEQEGPEPRVNGAEKSPGKEALNEAQRSPAAPTGDVNGVQKSPEKGALNVQKGPVSPATATEKSPPASPAKESVGEKVATSEELEGGKAEKESKPEAGEGETGEEAGEDAEDDDDDDDDDDEDGDGNAEDKEEEEVGNLQLAWEMLEVAKVIYKRKENKEDQLMAAQAYLKLGEVSAESGNYPQALEDFQECLALQLKHLPPHSRLLAESHYHVATTLCYMDQYSQAIQHYNSSIKVIENRLAILQEAIDAAEGGDSAKEERSEMEELKLLLPDVREKVEDAKESQRTASTASQAIQQTLGGASTSSAFPGENGGSGSAFPTASKISVRPSDGASSSKSISDISHLVRKKRKPEEEELPVEDCDAKQSKQEATVNGSGDSSAASNGVQEERKEPAKPSASVGS